MKIFNLVYALSISILITGCNLPKPALNNQQSSSFTATQITGAQIDVKLNSFGIPQEKSFQMSACLMDLKNRKMIINQKFIIESKTENFKSISDSNGCISWKEKISFNFINKPQYIQMTRIIKSESQQTGQLKVSYAVNLWEDQLSTVYDIAKNDLKDLIKDDKKIQNQLKGSDIHSQTPFQSQLWAEDGRLFTFDEKFINNEGVELGFNIRLNSSLILQKINQQDYYFPLQKGQVKGRIFILASDIENKNKKIIAKSETKTFKIENAQVNIAEKLKIKEIPKRGHLYLGVELAIESQDQLFNQQIKPFSAIYSLGEYDSIKSQAFLKVSTLADDKNPQFNQFSRQSEDTSKNKWQESLQKVRIEVAPIEYKFLRIKEDTPQKRVVLFNVKMCFINPLDHKPVRSELIQIKNDQNNEFKGRLDINACFNFDDEIAFDSHACQHYITKNYKTTSTALGIEETYQVLINPWEGSTGNAFRDSRYASENENKLTQCAPEKKVAAHLTLDNFHFTQTALDYEFDNLLNIQLVKKVHVRMEPFLLSPSSFIMGNSDKQPIKNGIYKLKLFIVNNYNSQKMQPIAQSQTFVNVIDGKINSDLIIKVEKAKDLAQRATLFVNLIPVNPEKIKLNSNGKIENSIDDESIELSIPTFTESLFTGPIILNLDQSSTPLQMVDSSSLAQFATLNKIQSTPSNASTNRATIKRLLSIFTNSKDNTDSKKLTSPVRNEYAKKLNLKVLSINHPNYGAEFYQTWNNQSPQDLANTQKELSQILNTGKLSVVQNEKMCNIWSQHILLKKNNTNHISISSLAQQEFKEICLRSHRNIFTLNKKIINEQIGATELIDGDNYAISSGTQFSLSRSFSDSINTNMSTSFSFKLVPEAILSFSPINSSLNYSISHSQSWGESESYGSNFGSNLSLTVQHNRFKINFSRYEKCLEIRLNPLYVENKKFLGISINKGVKSLLSNQFNDQEKNQIVSQGILLCSGMIESQPIEKVEDQFIVFQSLKSEEQQDSGNEKFRKFYLNLRGKKDFQRLFHLIKAQGDMPSQLTLKNREDTQEHQMNKLYELFNATPTYPGVYSE